jgi:hypothetical protein
MWRLTLVLGTHLMPNLKYSPFCSCLLLSFIAISCGKNITLDGTYNGTLTCYKHFRTGYGTDTNYSYTKTFKVQVTELNGQIYMEPINTVPCDLCGPQYFIGNKMIIHCEYYCYDGDQHNISIDAVYSIKKRILTVVDTTFHYTSSLGPTNWDSEEVITLGELIKMK